MGATQGGDGEAALSWPSNLSSTPVEVAEQISPLLFRYKRLTPGSGGRGRHRGGLGQEIEMVNESETPTTVTFLGERTRVPAPGLNGGEAGGLGAVQINGVEHDPRGVYFLERGDVLLVRTPGGGGFGPADAREYAERARDEAYEYV